ncbi:MAG: beta-ketoacyl-[acyl-carrier-protein] synthase family protein [Desulfotalea sp.]
MINRVAVTGVGVVSCLGNNAIEAQNSLRLGKSGIISESKREELNFFSPLTGSIKDFDPKNSGLTRKQRNTMPDFAVQAYMAAFEALEAAGLTSNDIQNNRTGLIFGNDSTSVAQVEQAEITMRENTTAAIGSGYCIRAMNSTVTLNLNSLFGTQGASWTLSSACSSGGHAIGQAADLIKLGKQDRIICGAAQEITWQSLCSFDALEAFSRRVEAPKQASRPFDANRDGLVPSGGAAAVILERYDLAVARGAVILGEIESYGFSSDGKSLCRPDSAGLQTAIKNALIEASLKPKDIDLVSAHATSTPVGDCVEANAISSVFGDKGVPVNALKSMTGHELWMSGASQIVYSILQAQGAFIAPTINFESPDQDSDKLDIITSCLDKHPGRILHNSAGFGGTNSCIIMNTRPR